MINCPDCGKVMEHTGRTPTHMASTWWTEENFLCRGCGIKGTVETSFTDANLDAHQTDEVQK